MKDFVKELEQLTQKGWDDKVERLSKNDAVFKKFKANLENACIKAAKLGNCSASVDLENDLDVEKIIYHKEFPELTASFQTFYMTKGTLRVYATVRWLAPFRGYTEISEGDKSVTFLPAQRKEHKHS